MNHPTVYGTSGVRESLPVKYYTYGGTEPFTGPVKNKPPAPTCSVDGCETHAHGHGLCPKHFYQAKKKEAGNAGSSS